METVEEKILKALNGMTVADALYTLDKCKDTLEKSITIDWQHESEKRQTK